MADPSLLYPSPLDPPMTNGGAYDLAHHPVTPSLPITPHSTAQLTQWRPVIRSSTLGAAETSPLLDPSNGAATTTSLQDMPLCTHDGLRRLPKPIAFQ